MFHQNKSPIWLWEFKRQMDLLRIISFARAYLKIVGNFFYVSKNNETNFYWDRISADKLSNSFLRKTFKSQKFIKQEFNRIKKYIDNFNRAIIEFKKTNWEKLSNKELLDKYFYYYELLYRGGLGAVFIRTLIFKGEPFLKESIGKLYKNSCHEAFTVLTTPSEISFTQEEEINLLKLMLFAKQNKLSIKSETVLKKINQHLKKYAYIPCGYFDESPYTVKDIMERLKKIKNLSVRKINDKIKTLGDKNKIRLQQIRFLKLIKNNDELNNLIKGIKLCVLYKEKIRGKMNEITYYAIPLFSELSKRIDLSIKEFKMFTPRELKEFLFGKNNQKKLINERLSYMVVVGDKKRIHIFDGKKAKKMHKFLLRNILKFDHENIIKGFSASSGKLKGKVKIIHKYIDSINTDEILVASMTTPEYVPLMKKAVAFITDEGGITCHAAIVAREMKKPCIIGTKIATKILKDGDLVEVDANNGIVKILKRK